MPRQLGTYRGYDGVSHYVHITPIPRGSDSMYFHCMGARTPTHPRDIDWSQPMRPDMFTNCLWCACDSSK